MSYQAGNHGGKDFKGMEVKPFATALLIVSLTFLLIALKVCRALSVEGGRSCFLDLFVTICSI